eukprot:4015020-Amphidinium_carterae.3
MAYPMYWQLILFGDDIQREDDLHTNPKACTQAAKQMLGTVAPAAVTGIVNTRSAGCIVVVFLQKDASNLLQAHASF